MHWWIACRQAVVDMTTVHKHMKRMCVLKTRMDGINGTNIKSCNDVAHAPGSRGGLGGLGLGGGDFRGVGGLGGGRGGSRGESGGAS